MASRQRSKVWLHYTKIDRDSARCNICNFVTKAKKGNTSNYRKHLTKHQIFISAEDCEDFSSLRADATTGHVTSAASSSSSTTTNATENDDGASVTASDGQPAAEPGTRTTQTTPFTLAKKAALTQQRKNECHRAVTEFIVKGMLPFCLVETPWFRKMVMTLNPKYTPPSRDLLTGTLIPSWYKIEKEIVKKELQLVDHVAVTADGWSSVAQDHYLTVTAHYIAEGELSGKVLHTRAVYVSQTGVAVAEERGSILDDFDVKSKVSAITVDNASNMEVAVKRMEILKMPCFAHTLNIAAQKLYNVKAVSNWSARVRAVVVWLRRNNLAKVVLKEKFKLLYVRKRSECPALILDVRTRWNSLFLMVERFVQMYPVIQAASLDPRLKKSMDRDKLERVTSDDLQRCEDFIDTMRVLYHSTLAVSAEKSATAGQILPILEKLQQKFEVKDSDSPFKRTIKETVWKDLEPRYSDEANYSLQRFLEEATALDPRFKVKVRDEDVWTRLKTEAVQLQVEAATRIEVGDGELTVTQEEEREKGDEVEVEDSEEDEDGYEDSEAEEEEEEVEWESAGAAANPLPRPR